MPVSESESLISKQTISDHDKMAADRYEAAAIAAG